MLDAIEKCSKPLQIARKDGKIWSFLYVSYDSDVQMWQALDKLQQYVQDTWGIYEKAAPFMCAAEDVENMIFQVLIKDTPVGMHSQHILEHFQRDTDLLTWNEIEVVCNLGGFLVNFIDFEDAMKYVRRSEKKQLFVQGKHIYARPQRNLVVVLKLFAHMQNTSRTYVSVQEIQDTWLRFAPCFDNTRLASIMQSLCTVFEKVDLDAPSKNSENDVFYRLHANKEILLHTYSMHRIQQLESKMEALLPVVSALFQKLLQTISQQEGVDQDATFDNTSPVMKTLLRECSILFQNDCKNWKTSQVVVCLCSDIMCTELKKITNIPEDKARALWGDSAKILPQVLADQSLISYKKIRCAGYRDMLKNPKGNLMCAMKALHICLDIVTWNTYVSLSAFECLCNIIHHSNDVIMAVVQETAPADT